MTRKLVVRLCQTDVRTIVAGSVIQYKSTVQCGTIEVSTLLAS